MYKKYFELKIGYAVGVDVRLQFEQIWTISFCYIII